MLKQEMICATVPSWCSGGPFDEEAILYAEGTVK